MPSIEFAYLGAGFLFSEAGLAIWRRASRQKQTENRDAGSLRRLWIVTSVSITAGMFLSAYGVKPSLPIGFPWPLCGVAVFCVGAMLRWWAIWHLGRFFTVNIAVASDHRIIDTGPYRFVRHPSYSGLILELAGLGLTLGTLPSLAAVVIAPTFALLHRVRIEEAALRAHLTDAYATYSARTKKIVPFVF